MMDHSYTLLLFWIQGVVGEYKGVHSPLPEIFTRPPTPQRILGFWQLATWSTWLLVIPNRFRPPGTLVIWTTFSIRVFPDMQSDLTLLAAGISILLQYLNSSMEQSDRSNWTLHATRCENIEEIRKGCSIILECCGQTPFLSSTYKLWQISSNALFLFEQQWWPDQPNETSLNIETPTVALKLSALLRPGWREQHHLIRFSMASLVTLRDWVMDFFDQQVHRDNLSIIQDALLVMQTAVDLFDLHDATQVPEAPVEPTDDIPLASTASAGS